MSSSTVEGPDPDERQLVTLESMLARGACAACSPLYLSYGIAALKGSRPALADGAAAGPSLRAMSRPMAVAYFGVFDGLFGAYSAKHLVERLHVAVSKGIERELLVAAPLFDDADIEGLWRTVLVDAFRVADDELIARVAGGVAVGSPAVVALVLEDHLVLANRGVTRAVIYRGEQAVQLTSDRWSQPYKQKEKQDVETEGGHVVGSTSNLEDDTATSQAISFRPYFPEPEVLMVKREPRDKFLILATGELWAHINPVEACYFIQKRLRMSRITSWATALDAMGSPTILANELAEQAIRLGSRSNVTVAIILFKNFWDEHCPGTSRQ